MVRRLAVNETKVLTRPTLVLNRNWQPVGVASVARSLTLVAGERARIIDPSTFQQYTWADWAKRIRPEADRTRTEAHMPLKKTPVRPTWRLLYAWHGVRIESWSRFLSEAYWTIELDA